MKGLVAWGTTMASAVIPEPQKIRAELERILASAPFAGAQRSQQFLRYVVQNSLENRNEALKEYTIAIEVFGRNSSYDPSIDATVRVEASRLRSRLRDYYIGDGQRDALIIEIPKGGYRAVFSERPQAAISGAGQTAELSAETSSGPANTYAKRLLRLAWALAAICVLAAVFGWIAIRHNSRRAAAHSQLHDPIRFAVLPFSNETGNTANNYITDGLTDNLIRQLSELPRLHVMARTAVDRVKQADVATMLGVTMALTGKLQRNADGRLVLDSELTNLNDGTVMVSRQHMADESDLASVQADVAQDVIQALGIELDAQQSADLRHPSTASAAAFQAFLRGESAARDPSPDGLHSAIRNYEEAIRLDDKFALAYEWLAETHTMLCVYFESAREHLPLARQYAERALSLDPSLGQAHGTLGLVALLYDWDLQDADNELASAETRLSAIHALGCAAHLYHFMGRDHIRHAEEDVRRLLEFDPHSATLVGELGCVSYYGHRYDDSLRYFGDALAADPRAPFLYWGVGRSLAIERRYDEALKTLRQFKAVNGFEPPIITAEIGYSEAASGDRSSALATVKQLEQLSGHTYVDPYFIALIYLGLKDADRTYQWLDRAYEARSPFLISIATDPKWSDSQGDHRFQKLWNRMMESGRSSASSAGVNSGTPSG